MARIDVIGLGPGGADLLSRRSLDVWHAAAHRFLRTTHHPAVSALEEAPSFDGLYETAGSFEELYRTIARSLATEARLHGHVVYAVPGSPSVAESTVEILLALANADDEVDVVVHPALSFLDLAWARLGIDPLAERVTLLDGHRFAESAPGGGGAVLVAQCESRFTLSDIKLSLREAPPGQAVLLHHLGLPDEAVVAVDWADIDRAVEPDHLTSLWIPAMPAQAGAKLEALASLVERLRVQDPWKAAQSHETLRRYLLEEAYEVLEAIDSYDPLDGDGAQELAAELGDLLYQVVFHASLGSAAGWFDLGDVVGAIHDKLLARHPHLGSTDAPSPEDLTADWERSKQAEHGRESAFDGVPAELPSLLRVMSLAKKADALGLDFPAPTPTEPGGVLLGAALAAIAAGVDPEDALRRELRAAEDTLRAAEQ